MTAELHAAIAVSLPDDPQTQASQVAAVTTAWAIMLSAIGASAPQATLSVTETDAKGTKRIARKPRVVATQINEAA